MTTDLTPEHTARRQGDNEELHPEVRAAYRYVESVLDSADIPSGKLGGPLWFGWALREAFLAGCSRAHIALAQPEPEERPIWTEGVCGDGAAILKDGVMQPIESVITALNAAELAQPEPEGPTVIGPEWQPCVKLPITVHVREQRPGETHSSTREGITPLRPDDLIMRGVQGEEYPIGRELFNQTYRMGATLTQPEPEGDEGIDDLAAWLCNARSGGGMQP
jgi:hypothetical protein